MEIAGFLLVVAVSFAAGYVASAYTWPKIKDARERLRGF